VNDMNRDVERLKRRFVPGMRVRLVYMDDAQAPPQGTMGTVKCVDDIGTIHVNWDNGSSLGVAWPIDNIEVVKEGANNENNLLRTERNRT